MFESLFYKRRVNSVISTLMEPLQMLRHPKTQRRPLQSRKMNQRDLPRSIAERSYHQRSPPNPTSQSLRERESKTAAAPHQNPEKNPKHRAFSSSQIGNVLYNNSSGREASIYACIVRLRCILATGCHNKIKRVE